MVPLTYHLAAVAENADHASLTNTNWATTPSGQEGVHSLPNADELRPKDKLASISWAMLGAPNATRARILSSHLRDLYSDQGPDVQPLVHGASVEIPETWADYRASPIPLQNENILRVQTEHDNGAAEDIWGLIALGTPRPQDLRGRALTYRMTTTTDLSNAEAWDPVTDFQLTQDAPAGRSRDYQVVGGALVQDGGDARAWRLPGLDAQVDAMPGAPAYTDVDQARWSAPWRYGRMGRWGTVPGADLEDGLEVQVFADTASSQDFELFLDLVW